MDIRKVKKLIELLEESDVEELEIHEGDDSVRISRRREQVAGTRYVSHYPAPAPQSAPAQDPAPAPAQETPAPAAPSGHSLKSPMVGTFYRAPSPSGKAFVEVGQSVKAGGVVCIVEAMKMMNEIESEYDGVVEEILADNATSVEYGQPIFVITPLG